METFGKWLELTGTIFTALGLLYAWWKADGRLRTLGVRIALLPTTIRGLFAPPVHHTADAQLTIVADIGASADVASKDELFDGNKSTAENFVNVGQKVQHLRRDLEAAKAESEGRDRQIRAELTEAIEEAIGEFKDDLDASTVKDLIPAIIAIGVTAVGILMGIIAG